MNSETKNSIFNKKNIIIGIVIVAIILLVICLVFLGKPKQKTMYCTMSIDNYDHANISIEMNAYYKEYINSLDGKINFEVTNETLKDKIDIFEKQLKNNYSELNKSASIDIDVYREDYTIVIDYNIDYENVSEEEMKKFGIFPNDEISSNMTIDEFKNQILSSGGTCVEE